MCLGLPLYLCMYSGVPITQFMIQSQLSLPFSSCLTTAPHFKQIEPASRQPLSLVNSVPVSEVGLLAKHPPSAVKGSVPLENSEHLYNCTPSSPPHPLSPIVCINCFDMNCRF